MKIQNNNNNNQMVISENVADYIGKVVVCASGSVMHIENRVPYKYTQGLDYVTGSTLSGEADAICNLKRIVRLATKEDINGFISTRCHCIDEAIDNYTSTIKHLELDIKSLEQCRTTSIRRATKFMDLL